MGVQSCNIETQKSFQEIRSIGKIGVEDRILESNQTSNLSIDFVLNDVGTNDPFFDFKTGSNVLSTENFNFDIKDLVGQSVITGAYMTNYSIQGSVGELTKGSIKYECDFISLNETGKISYSDQSNDDFGVYRPKDIQISSTFDEGISTSGLCIQDFNLSFSIAREAKNRIGTRTPITRFPKLPSNGEFACSVIKNKVTGIDLSSLVLDKGTLSIKLNNGQDNQKEYRIQNCSLVSLSENHDLDGNATLDFNYVFSLDRTGVSFNGPSLITDNIIFLS